MKNLIVLLLLIITSFTNNVNAQNDSLTRKFKSIKTYTIGDKFEKKGKYPDDPSTYYLGEKPRYSIDIESLGSFERVDLLIYTTENDTIYKLGVDEMSCGSSAEKAKTFRINIQEFYNITFKLLPIKPSTPYKAGSYYAKTIEYIYVAYKNGIKYTLTSNNIGMGVTPSKISMFNWNVSFSMTDLSLEKRKNQQDKIKALQEQSKAKNNF